jgi:hypothetical protein
MAEEVNRVERLLAMILLHDMQDASVADKASSLSHAGFTPGEIASMLGTTSASISQQLYTARRTGGGRRKGAARKGAARKGATRKRSGRKRSRGD